MADKPMIFKRPNIFEQRRRVIDEASGWAEPARRKPQPSNPAPVVQKKNKRKAY